MAFSAFTDAESRTEIGRITGLLAGQVISCVPSKWVVAQTAHRIGSWPKKNTAELASWTKSPLVAGFASFVAFCQEYLLFSHSSLHQLKGLLKLRDIYPLGGATSFVLWCFFPKLKCLVGMEIQQKEYTFFISFTLLRNATVFWLKNVWRMGLFAYQDWELWCIRMSCEI